MYIYIYIFQTIFKLAIGDKKNNNLKVIFTKDATHDISISMRNAQ